MTNGWEMSFTSRSPCMVKLLNYIEAEIYQIIKYILRIYPASVAHMFCVVVVVVVVEGGGG